MVVIRYSRFRIRDVIRWSLIFLSGFLARNILDLSALRSFQTACAPCPTPTDFDDLLPRDIHIQLREPYRPKGLSDVIEYEYFNMSSIMKSSVEEPKIALLGSHKSDIKDALHQALILHNARQQSQWKLKNLVNGYKRCDPLRGEEYIFDVVLQREENNEVDRDEAYRISMVKPYAPAQLVGDSPIEENDKLLHIILPVTVSNPRLRQFLKNFEQICIVLRDDIYLLIVLFVNPELAGSLNKASSIKEQTSAISRKHHNAHISILQTRKPYARSLGIDLGIKHLPHVSLVFFCSVDVDISPSFVMRCKRNALINKQVYYPIIFAQYDPKIVQMYSRKKDYKDLSNISKHTGHWAHYRYDTSCMYAEDYRSVGGLNLHISGWGREDIDLYKRFLQSPLQILRATDPGLILTHHTKSCRSSLAVDQFRMCQESQAESRGSKQQLAKALLDHWNKY